MTEDGGAVDQGQAVQLAPTDAELERAIASVPGVVSADIDRSGATGRSRMRLRLAPGEDEEAVAWAVAATLRERFGIALDPDAIRPRVATDGSPGVDPVRVVATPAGRDERPSRAAEELSQTRERLRRAAEQALEGLPADSDGATPTRATPTDGATLTSVLSGPDEDATAEAVTMSESSASEPGRPATGERVAIEVRTVVPRAAIRHLEVRRDDRSVEVVALLEHLGRCEEGRAVSVPTSHGTFRAVAEATVAALRGLTEGSLLVGIDRISVKQQEEAPTATVVLSLLTRRGEERLLGASMVARDGAERAVMRATLDALNRRVTPLLLERGAELDVSR